MRLICPNCDAQYEVDEGAIPQGGRDVQCSNCGHAWFQTPADAMAEADADLDVPAAPVVSTPPPPKPAAPKPGPADPAPAPVAAEPVASAEVSPAPAPATGPVRRTLDENLLNVLREEAAREAAERRAEAGRGIETQPELGLPEAGRRPTEPAAVEAPVPDHPVIERPNARRDLLPDIEEINSTLRPGSETRETDRTPPPAAVPRRASFRRGFLSVLLIAVVLVVLYTTAPQISARFPALAGAMTAYVEGVDALRVWLDMVMKSAADGLHSLTGDS